MSFNEHIPSLTLLTIVVGWLVNGYLQRNHEIIKKRMNYRVDMLENYLLFFKKANDNKDLDGFDDIQVSFLIYGHNDEINLIKEIAKIIKIINIINAKTVKEQPNDKKKLAVKFNELDDKFNELNELSRNKLRMELKLPEIKE